MSDHTFDEMEIEAERYELREPTRFSFAPDRRRFVQIASGGLMLAARVRSSNRVYAQRGRTARRDEWLSERFLLGQDGYITVFTSKVEVGQGSRTQLTQAAAEELGLPIERVLLVMADTKLCPNDGGTAGSRTTPSTVPRIRNAAAAIRKVLVDYVAAQLAVSPSEIVIRDGAFTAPGHRQVTIAELASDEKLRDTLTKTSPPENTQVKPVSNWQVLGTSIEKVTSRSIVTGAAIYPADVSRPGMLYGTVLRPISYGAKLVDVDLTVAQADDRVNVVRDGDFIGCVAHTSFAARQARDAIAATARWEERPDHPDSSTLVDHLKATAERRGSPKTDGDPQRALAEAAHRMSQTYAVAYIQHAPMEPRAAVAEWNADNLTVWTGTQQPDRVHGELTQAFRLPAEAVRVIVPDTGGGFGGKHTGEVAVEAARLAKSVRKPVSLRWTREEEFTWAYFRPAGRMEVNAGVDRDGKLLAWEFTNYNSGGSAIETPYTVPNSAVQFVQTDSPLRQGSYRALASTANTFARESAMDELAAMAMLDPLQFRLRNLADGRLKNVLLAATEKFAWQASRSDPAKQRGVGLACGTEKGSYVAACAEVEVTGPQIRVVRVCQAYECGAIQNPDNLRAQVEGALVQGLGGGLYEAIEFRNGQIVNDNFSSYRVPRMRDLPEIDIVLVNRVDLPSVGGSETPIIAIAPAIANAIAAASGIRARELPLKLA